MFDWNEYFNAHYLALLNKGIEMHLPVRQELLSPNSYEGF